MQQPCANIETNASAMSLQRSRLLEQITADLVAAAAQTPDQPRCVAISGITAAGKSTFANQLAHMIRRHATAPAVLRASIDDFHRPAALRNRPDLSPELSYYEHAHDLAALRERLLDPLVAVKGSRRVQTASWNLAADCPSDPPPITVADHSIVLVDGTFLLKRSLRPYWRYAVWLDVDFTTARQRGAARDAALLGGYNTALDRYKLRYHAACTRYLREHAPRDAADCVIDHRDPNNPTRLPVNRSRKCEHC